MHTAQPLFTNQQQGPLLVQADFNELFLISDTLSNLLINFISSNEKEMCPLPPIIVSGILEPYDKPFLHAKLLTKLGQMEIQLQGVSKKCDTYFPLYLCLD